MPSRQNQPQEIRPAIPDDLTRGLLTLVSAQICPLTTGDSVGGCAREGEYAVIGAAGGKVTVTAHNQYALLTAGQAIVLEATGSYTLQAVSDCTVMTVLLRGELAERLFRERLTEGAAHFAGGGGVVRETALALAVMDSEHPPVNGALASAYGYALLMRLRALPEKEPGKKAVSSLVEGAIAIIQEDFPYLEGLDDLADRLEVSKAHLIRTFTKETGISPARYITRVRIEYAKLLLRDQDASVTYVAEASGFANANYFAKVFRRETGMSPSDYLKNAPSREGRQNGPQDRHILW